MALPAGDQEFDVVILGGGSGGYAAALRSAQLGKSVALIEKDKLGGTCLHRGCIPTKALLHTAEVADAAADSAKVGVKASFDGIDMSAVNSFKAGIVNGLYKGLQGLVKGRGITYVAGTGRLTGPDTVEVVDGEGAGTYRGGSIVLATGSYSKSLPGLEIGGRVITSEQALQLDWVPQHPIVLGGGVIGVEFASVWRSFGAEPTIVEGFDHLAPNEEPEISKALERAFRRRHIAFNLGTFFSGVEQTADGVTVTLADGKTFEGDLLLVAVGRGPVTADLGYEENGITLDRGFVITDEHLRTGVGNVYAVGDIVPGPQLAHRGFQQGIFVAEEIAGQSPRIVSNDEIPKVTYCEPNIASVGITEARAVERFGADAVETAEYNLAGNGKSKILGTQGFVKVVRQKDGPVVGVHMIGSRVGELIGEAQLIVGWEAQPEDIAPYIHAHPTQTEVLGEVFLDLSGKPLHSHV